MLVMGRVNTHTGLHTCEGRVKGVRHEATYRFLYSYHGGVRCGVEWRSGKELANCGRSAES
jgi:hypothetical protein